MSEREKYKSLSPFLLQDLLDILLQEVCTFYTMSEVLCNFCVLGDKTWLKAKMRDGGELQSQTSRREYLRTSLKLVKLCSLYRYTSPEKLVVTGDNLVPKG